MDISWIVFFGVVAFCTYRGYRLGLFNSLSRVVGLVAGYATALMYYDWAAALLQRYTAVEGVLAYVIGGVTLFIAANFAVSVLYFGVRKVFFPDSSRSRVATVGGVAAGVVFGVFWGLLAVFTISYSRDMLASDSNSSRPHSAIERWAHDIAAKVVDGVAQASDVNPAVRSASVALAKDPQKVSNQLRQLSQSPELKSLFNNKDNANALRSEDAGAIVKLPAFQQLVNNPDFRDLMQSVGLNPDDGAAFEQEVAQQLGRIWNRVQSIKDSDKVQAILQDPGFKERLEGRNPIQLLTDSRFMELVQLVLSPTAAADKLGQSAPNDKPTRIYQWTDANGETHFSDRPPAAE